MGAYARNKTDEQRRIDSSRWFNRKIVAAHNDAILDRRMGRAPAYVNPFHAYRERNRINILRHPTWFPTEHRVMMRDRIAAAAQSQEGNV
jgi:hypothetical protein